MKLTAYIADDEQYALDVLASYIERAPGIELIGSSTSAAGALAAILEHRPSVAFLDIDMPGLTGLDLAAKISPRCLVVFTTSYREYAPEAFEQDAVDYLLKPYGYERFLTCLQKITRLLPAEQPVLLIKPALRGKTIRVAADEIRYIEGAGNYVYLYLDGEKITSYMSILEIQRRLPPGRFIRTHHSFVVNGKRVRGLAGGRVILDDDSAVPLGRAYKAAFHDWFRAAADR